MENFNEDLLGNGGSTRQEDLEIRLRMAETALDFTSDCLLWISLEGKFKFVNSTTCESLGYTRSELMELDIYDLDPNTPKKKINAQIQECRVNKSIKYETAYRDRFGILHPVEVHGNYFQFLGEDYIFYSVHVITEKKAIEIALKENEEKIHQAQKMEIIAQLAGRTVQDFDNLLKIINGYSSFLLDGCPEELHESLNEVRRSAEKAFSLTSDLVKFTNQEIVKSAPVNLNEVILNLKTLLVSLLGSQIQLLTQLECELCDVFADPKQIDQVLRNLILNSRDALPNGGVIEINTDNIFIHGDEVPQLKKVKSGYYARIKILYSGAGISKNALALILDPLYSVKPQYKRTGLRVSIVHRVIKQLKGYIFAKNLKDQGACIHILIPQLRNKISNEILLESNSKSLTEPNFSAVEKFYEKFVDKKILVVEDQTEILDLICLFLKDAPSRIFPFISPLKVLKLINEEKPPLDLIICDLMMPELSGVELCRYIHNHYPNVKFLLISGFAYKIIHEHSPNDIIFDFLQKPFSRDQLIQKIYQLFNK